MENITLTKEQQAQLTAVAERFLIEGVITEICPYGEGHINVTYRVTTDKKRYILQKMNTRVFTDPDGLMANICAVTSYLEAKGIETLHVVKTVDGAPFLKSDACYRVFDFIEKAVSHQSNIDAAILRKAGAAFGTFIGQLDGFDAAVLVESIRDFHNTPKRFRDFQAAVDKDACGRAATAQDEIRFFLDRADTFDKVVKGLADGTVPLRVTHNDTKLNNILMDEKTGNARAIIDLDTIMPGSMLYDFGDSIRFGASTAAEDEQDLNKVHFSLDLFTAYAEGYCVPVKGCITPREVELLPYSAYLLTAECGMRFLADYLSGDTYFATKYPEHNLVRARTQIRLAAEMWEQQTAMAAVVNRILGK